MFEIAKRIAVEQDKNGNHFCIAHSSLSIASFRGVWRWIWKRKCFFVQFQLLFFAEIICNIIDFHNFADKFHEDYSFVIWLIFNNKYTKTILFWGFCWNYFKTKTSLAYPELGLLTMELFAAMQIAAYQRKRTVRYIFFGVCSENVYLCLQQRPFKWQPVPSSNRFIRLSSPAHDTKNGYDLVTQLRSHLAFFRFSLALPFLPALT